MILSCLFLDFYTITFIILLMIMDYKLLLEEILDSENYLCLATSTPLGQPWATPLCFVRGDNNNLYFVSQNESLHALHIAVNPHVAFSIFNTEQPL
jgi:nitroimidazol reductase NimA-like FMN-containing flavoprotein (pyridoxamine 5'-phosphate oxidase superfamily)